MDKRKLKNTYVSTIDIYYCQMKKERLEVGNQRKGTEWRDLSANRGFGGLQVEPVGNQIKGRDIEVIRFLLP